MLFQFRIVAMAIFIVIANLASAKAHHLQDEALDRAVGWLINQQGESGAWKSKHYGAMKQGAALTSLALYSLSMTPNSIREHHAKSIDRAFKFLNPGTLKRNRVANPDGSLDHPVYSTSMFLTAAHRMDVVLDPQHVDELLNFLVDSQCVEGRGFTAKNPNHGGWDVIGPDVFPGKTSGTNVSATRFALEAFASFVPLEGKPKLKLSDQTIQRVRESRKHAAAWLKRIHDMNDDGGFRFSAQPNSALNKSKTGDGEVRSYGSATCDGLLGFRFGGIDDNTTSATWAWIEKNTTSTKVPGFDESEFQSAWPQALKFYYFQSLSRVLEFSSNEQWTSDRRGELVATLNELQFEDGRFENKSALMRENDPIIATAFAVIALSQKR